MSNRNHKRLIALSAGAMVGTWIILTSATRRANALAARESNVPARTVTAKVLSVDELPKLSQSDGLALDIDVRLRDLWAETEDVAEWDLEAVAAFMRAAYGKGYVDALGEVDRDERAKLCRENGYRLV